MKKLTFILLLFASILSLTACGSDSKDEPKTFAKTDYEILAGETATIQGTGLNDVVWESSDKFVAEAAQGAVINAHKVGKTTIHSTEINGFVSVEVKPKITTYSEPMLRYGSKWQNGQLVIDYNQHQYMWGTANGLLDYNIRECGLPWTIASKGKDVWTYKTGNNATPLIGYMFNDEGRMNATCIYLNPLYADDLFDFINERFLIYSADRINLTADFAHATVFYNDEVKINYTGRVGASSSVGMILIMYYADLDNVRSEDVADKALRVFEQAITIQ